MWLIGRLKVWGVKKVKVRNGLIARYYNYSGDTSNVTLVRVDTVPGSYVWSFTVKVDDGSGSWSWV